MKRILLLLVIGFLLAACASTSTETAVSVPEAPARPETAVPEEAPAAEFEAETESEESSMESAIIPGFPATTVQEASIVRERDWKKGAEDPLVSIIEYGDFQ
jgi:PBP1b-binding outer membrane lipoprotein LpoB